MRTGGEESTAARFVGRERELAALEGCLAEVLHGHPRVAVVEGPAGIGKTTLVDRFLAAAGGTRIVRGSGEQAERSLAYGLVDQLLRAADAPRAVFASPHRSGDHVSIGLRLLQAFGALEESEPVVVAVDDAHWVDAASLRALLFASRRLVAERILVVIAMRDDEGAHVPPGLRRMAEGAGGCVIRLGPLNVPELQRLAAAEGIELPAASARRLHAHTSGNPLHALALLRELPGGAWQDPRGALPVPRSFTEIVLGSLAACSAPTRRLVEAAAVLGRRSPLALAARLAAIDEPFDALEQAVAARLLAPDAGADEYEATFPHPLIETAVYRQIGAARRARLHAEAAALVEDAAVALRHRVAAAPGPDPELAGELAEFARREEGRAAWANVAWALAAAARLSESRSVREPRMLAAAEATLLAGDLEGASRLSERVSDPANPPLRDCVLAFLALLGPRPRDAEPLLERAWRECDPDADPETAARVASTTALLRLMEMRGTETEAWSRRAIALTPAPSKVQDQLMTAIGVMLAGRMAEAEATARAMLAENPDASELLCGLGWVLLARDNLAGATVELTRAAAAARRNGSFEQAALAHAHLCRAEYMAGRWDAALAQSEQSLALMAELPNLNVRPMVHWSATLIPAARGDSAATEEIGRLAALDAAGTLDRALVAGLVRALPAAARGDHATVIAALEPFAGADGETGDGIHEPGVWPWHDLYAEALVAAGRLDDAAAFLPAHERRARERGLGSALARLGRARGRLDAARGDIDAAVGAFEAAIEHARLAGVPFEGARAELALGALLRRQGRRREAADRLRAAHTALTDLGATPYLARCDRELSACGLTPMKRSRPDPTRLTPQERSVADLVASGMTNREVAAELLVSVKTVEVHLTRIYAKLGITSRGQLGAQSAGRNPEQSTRIHPMRPSRSVT